MEIKGRIYKVLAEQGGTNREGKEWRRLDFIFEYFERPGDRYSDKVVLSVMNERIDQYKIKEGDEVVIGFGHNVREYQGRWYNEMRIYKYENAGARTAVPQPQQNVQAAQPLQTTLDMVAAADTGKEDNLPF